MQQGYANGGKSNDGYDNKLAAVFTPALSK